MDDLAVQFLLLNGDEADLFDNNKSAQVLAAALIAGIKISQEESINTRCRDSILSSLTIAHIAI
jgi:hypothetical protein